MKKSNRNCFLFLVASSLVTYYLLLSWSSSQWDTADNDPTHPSHLGRPSVRFASQQFDPTAVDEAGLVLFSRCYCQKDLVYVKKSGVGLEVTVRDQQEQV